MDPFTRKVVGLAVIAAGLTVLIGAAVAPRAFSDFGVRSVVVIFLAIAAAVLLWHRLRSK